MKTKTTAVLLGTGQHSKKRMITAERFKSRVKSEPMDDDLDRCNCEKAGTIGHQDCGWCAKHDMPVFICPCPYGKAELAPVN